MSPSHPLNRGRGVFLDPVVGLDRTLADRQRLDRSTGRCNIHLDTLVDGLRSILHLDDRDCWDLRCSSHCKLR